MGRIISFLGSMSLAVTLLIIVSIASVIGTVLQQNQNYVDYKIRFGEFYFELFRRLGLFDVYHASWFMATLAFLLFSVTTCVIRQSPGRLKKVNNWSPLRRGRSAKTLSESSPHSAAEFLQSANATLTERGYRVRRTNDGLLARKNRFHPLGYIATHLAIILIIIGALIDSNPLTQWKLLRGNIQYEKQIKPVSQLPENRFLPANNLAFRGNINVSEGESASVLFLNHKDGYLVQRLPFNVAVKDFRIEHYDNGQPKSYESDIVVRALDGSVAPVSDTISVNKPLRYMGIDIFQASFSDGGSKLALRTRNLLDGSSINAHNIAVGQGEDWYLGDEPHRLEIDDFRLFNIENFAENEDDKADWRNVGPSVGYKIRQPDGSAAEFLAYQVPVNVEGHDYLYYAYRTEIDAPFIYVRIPVDPAGGLDWFHRYYANLSDDAVRTEAVSQLINQSISGDTKANNDAIRGAIELSNLFVDRGFGAIDAWVAANVDEANRDKVLDHYVRVIRIANEMIFFKTLSELNVAEDEIDPQRVTDFFVNAVAAASDISDFPIAAVVELTNFEHIQATGLQMTRSPGRLLVYPGCLLLVIGVFIMFYLNERRISVIVNASNNGQTAWDIIGKAEKRRDEFAEELDHLRDELRHSNRIPT